MRQLAIFTACWAVTDATLWALTGDAGAVIATTFFAAVLYVPVSVLHYLHRRNKLQLLGHFCGCWAVIVLGLYWADPVTIQDSQCLLSSLVLAVLLLIPWVAVRAIARAFGKPGAGRPAQSGLDAVLLWWTQRDPFTMRNLLDGGCCILGRPGSGKTSSSGKLLAQSLVAFPRSGGLILGSSPTDLAMWQGIFAKAGRANDLIAFGPQHHHRFNMVRFLAEMGADQKDLAKAILTIGEARDNDEAGGGKDGEVFWVMQSKSKLETAVSVLLIAGEDVSIPNIHKFMINAAATPDEIKSEEWRAKYHSQCFARGYAAQKTKIQEHDFQLAWDTWLVQWPAMNDRTRTSIEAAIGGTLHVFNSGQVRSLLSEGTTLTPAVLDQGKWVFVDMSVGQFGSSGAFVLNAWKHATQKYVTRRNPAAWRNPIIIWADEAGKTVNSADSFYLTESRKFGGATVFLAQSMQSFHAALPGERGKSQAEVLLGCFSTKILHAIGDPGTAEWASKLLGNEVKMRYSYGGNGGQHSPGEEVMGKSQMSFNSQEHLEPVLQTNDFMHNLATGGKNNNYRCDAIIIRTGEPFSNGCSWILRPFSQV